MGHKWEEQLWPSEKCVNVIVIFGVYKKKFDKISIFSSFKFASNKNLEWYKQNFGTHSLRIPKLFSTSSEQ